MSTTTPTPTTPAPTIVPTNTSAPTPRPWFDPDPALTGAPAPARVTPAPTLPPWAVPAPGGGGDDATLAFKLDQTITIFIVLMAVWAAFVFTFIARERRAEQQRVADALLPALPLTRPSRRDAQRGAA